MLSEFIDKIIEKAVPQKLKVDDREYFTRQLFPVLEPMPENLQIHTLTGLVDFINDFGKTDILIQIWNSTHVSVIGQLQAKFMQRPTYISATHTKLEQPFDRWMDLEPFIIAMQAMFVQDDTVSNILSLIGNIKDGTVKTYSDDGITQAVTAKTGAASINEILVPNPVTLQPYRTFMEIDQPASQFIFRMRSGPEGGTPTCYLTEADGGKWKIEAILRIREWLTKKLPDIPIIA